MKTTPNAADGISPSRLVNSPNWRLRLIAVESLLGLPEKLSKELALTLAKDAYSKVRLALAENLSTPSEALELLVADSFSSVVLAVASHPNTSNETLDKLANHRSPAVAAKARSVLTARQSEKVKALPEKVLETSSVTQSAFTLVTLEYTTARQTVRKITIVTSQSVASLMLTYATTEQKVSQLVILFAVPITEAEYRSLVIHNKFVTELKFLTGLDVRLLLDSSVPSTWTTGLRQTCAQINSRK